MRLLASVRIDDNVDTGDETSLLRTGFVGDKLQAPLEDPHHLHGLETPWEVQHPVAAIFVILMVHEWLGFFLSLKRINFTSLKNIAITGLPR